MCRDVRLSAITGEAITGELDLGNIREATNDQVRAVQESLALAGADQLTSQQLAVIKASFARTLVDTSGVPVHSGPTMLAGAI